MNTSEYILASVTVILVLLVVLLAVWITGRATSKTINKFGRAVDGLKKYKIPKLELENNYKWRRFKVLYIVTSLVIIAVMAIGIFAVNQQKTCETSSKVSWSQTINKSGSPDISTTCLSADARGEGISIAILLIPAILAVVGYKFLPKLYLYLKPSSK